MKPYVILLFFVLTFVGYWACHYSVEHTKDETYFSDNIFFQNIATQDSIFTFLAEEGFEHEFATGTKVQIPKGALLSKAGEIVNGPVILSFSAFRDAVDLLSIGVLMDSEFGLNKTAGAFRIEVEQAGKQLILDPSKSIAVKLACYEKEDNYGLYFLNHGENQWEYLYTIKPTINAPHVQLERAKKRLIPRIKFPLDEEYFSLNYKGILDIFYNNNLTNVNHRQTLKKMGEYGLRWPNVMADTLVDFEGSEIKASSLVWHNISRKHFPDWTKNKKGRIEKIKDTRYRLSVINESDSKKFSTQIEAVLPLKKLFSYGPGYWKYDYYSKLKLVSATQNELLTLPTAYRSFRINHFGIYNWQKTIDEMESVKINAQVIDHNKSAGKEIFTGFYYLTGDFKGLIYYPFSEWNDVRLLFDQDARIFAFSHTGILWIFPIKEMEAIDINQLKKMKNPSFKFKMDVSKEKPNSIEELRSVLYHNNF
jgi:hypothetical protein